MLIWCFFYLPTIANRSKVHLFRWGVILTIGTAILWLPLAFLNNRILVPCALSKSVQTVLLWALLLTVITIRNCGCEMAYVSVFVMLNNSVLDGDLGLVNGFGQSKYFYIHTYVYYMFESFACI
jgi:hypothetical protein